MSWNTPRRFSAMLLVVVVTCNFQPSVSLNTQRCFQRDSNYYQCNQICRGGRCILSCNASDVCHVRCNGGTCKPMCDSKTCDLSCNGGRCRINCRGELCKVTCNGGTCLVTCHSKTCDLLCAGGSCEMDCKGEHCNAKRTGGRCTLKCPANAKTCTGGSWCNTVRPTPSTETTALTFRPTVRPQIHNRTCYPPRSCVCPRVPNYYRCNQICRGGNCSCNASDLCDIRCNGGTFNPILCDSKICDLSCIGGRCMINCTGELCEVTCNGGVCLVTCHSTDIFNIMCKGGRWKPILCTAKTCDLLCTVGSCEMDYKGEHCIANCTGGRSTLKCPASAKTCNLRCTGGLCRTIRPRRTDLTTVTPTNPQPTTPHNQLNTFQTCANLQGGCILTCPRRSNYSSCQQNCNRGKWSFFLKEFFIFPVLSLTLFANNKWMCRWLV